MVLEFSPSPYTPSPTPYTLHREPYTPHPTPVVDREASFFLASQTLQNRKFLKKKLGEVPLSFCIFFYAGNTYIVIVIGSEIYSLKEVIRGNSPTLLTYPPYTPPL
jgi:hypothetical protein